MSANAEGSSGAGAGDRGAPDLAPDPWAAFLAIIVGGKTKRSVLIHGRRPSLILISRITSYRLLSCRWRKSDPLKRRGWDGNVSAWCM